MAWSLAERYGVGTGDRVAVLSRNDTRVFEVVYACALLGAIAVPLNWRLTSAELTAMSRMPSRRPRARELAGRGRRPRWPGRGHPGRVGLGQRGRRRRRLRGAGDGGRAGGLVPPEDVDDDAVWTIIYTSGTTGLPKGVQATHRGWLASLLGILVAHRVGADSRCLTVLPLFHVAGLNLFANPVLYAGGTVVVARAFDPAQALALLTDPTSPVTHFCGVPANYQFMEQLPGVRRRAAAAVRRRRRRLAGPAGPGRVVGGTRGVALTTVYGITEAGRLRDRHAAGAGARPQRHRRAAAALLPLPGADARRPAGRRRGRPASCSCPGRW